jgi:polysaccharide export outer membrane protein
MDEVTLSVRPAASRPVAFRYQRTGAHAPRPGGPTRRAAGRLTAALLVAVAAWPAAVARTMEPVQEPPATVGDMPPPVPPANIVPAPATPPAPGVVPPYEIGPGDMIEISFYRKYDVAAGGYVLDVGDVLSIVVEDHPELSAETVVRPDGMISAPLLGDVHAGGQSTESLRDLLTRDYASRVPAPIVTVFVKAAQAKLNEFFTTMMSSVGGATRSLTVRPDGNLSLPLLGEVGVAGRTVGDLQTSLSQRYQAIFRYIDISINVVSSLYQRIAVLGEVARPGVFPVNGELSLPQALAMAGGFLESAQPKNVIVIRQNPDETYTGVKYNMKEMVQQGGTGMNVFLHPRDIIVVPKSRIARVDKWVDQYIRKVLPFNIGAGVFYTINGNNN